MAMARSADIYADFLLPHLSSDTNVVDVGCGSGELALDLAATVGQITGIDNDEAEVDDARHRAGQLGVDNAVFSLGDAYTSGLPDDHADVVFAHSVLETLERPNDALTEMKRILKPGGVLGTASVDYGGLVLAGRDEAVLRRFYEIRERLWQVDGADPFRGRQLRGLLLASGFVDVTATAKYISYGTTEAVREFGLGRADDCVDDWYVGSAQRHGLATLEDLAAMRRAWLQWAEASTSYAAFAWCRALGRKPWHAEAPESGGLIGR